MKRSWLPYLILTAVIAVLTLFFGLQYRWMREASEAERERMQRRVAADTKAFADDFNREIQSVYFNLQLNAEVLKSGDLAEFNDRYDFWRGKTAYPELLRDIVYLPPAADESPQRYDRSAGSFAPFEADSGFGTIKDRIASGAPRPVPVLDDLDALIMPIVSGERHFQRIVVDRVPRVAVTGKTIEVPEQPLNNEGHIVIRLNRKVMTERMLPELAAKHFSSGEYRLSVAGKGGSIVYGENGGEPDGSAGLYDLRPNTMIFFANREMDLPSRSAAPANVIVDQRIESTTVTNSPSPARERDNTFTFEMRSTDGVRQRSAVIATPADEQPWTLKVTHASGSIGDYIRSEERKNLAIGAGIYSLLVGSILAITISANRARTFAQKQVDFVSSVSHEFRTPLAVIYSAGENLADGIARSDDQVARYGELIKGEGRKLTGMVEQILEFAGARSGKRRYNFVPADAGEIVREVVNECRGAIEGSPAEIEIDIAGNLPKINADSAALSLAIQNLVNNAVKYSSGTPRLEIRGTNGNGRVSIAVKDHGIGIAEKDVKKIFEPFFRSREVVDSQISGNGLGLSLVKEIVAAHGGSVEVESVPGKGSTFTISLPAEARKQ
ncbi:MAG: HAMP domain-containing histidine kinase [Acidobacteria bacterium]|nr:HAMP domain-containing histidine kinase [Acidobacteriota bacterium]